jgi:hypothetical protein
LTLPRAKNFTTSKIPSIGKSTVCQAELEEIYSGNNYCNYNFPSYFISKSSKYKHCPNAFLVALQKPLPFVYYKETFVPELVTLRTAKN